MTTRMNLSRPGRVVSNAAVAVVAVVWCAWSTPIFDTAAHAEPPCTLIRGATVYGPGAVRLDNHDVKIEGPAIQQVGPGIGAGRCEVVEARGLVVTAGFIDPFTTLGLVEIDGEGSTVDTDNKSLHQDDQQLVRAAIKTSLAYNPRSIPITIARAAGVTSALSLPVGGVIAGQGFWIDLHGSDRQAIQRDPAALMVTLGVGGESRASSLLVLDLALREAEVWRLEKRALERAQRAPLLTPTLDLEALDRMLSDKVPLVVRVDRASDIENLFAMLGTRKVPLVLVGAAEAWLIADKLAARDVAVVLDPLVFGPGGFDQLAARSDQAALLVKAGVKVMMSAMDTHLVKKLRQVVGNAIREGLAWEDGLKAVTEVPAQVFGMKDHGRLARGARANLVVWSGDPFELSTQVVRVYIGGDKVDLRTRQTRLFERYKTLPLR